MKFLSLIFLIALLFSIACTGPRLLEKDESYQVLGFDFREYADVGFLITPESYSGRYQSLGLVDVVYDPEIIKETERGAFLKAKPGYTLISDRMGSMFQVKRADQSAVIRALYEVANEMGADAIVNFNIQNFSIERAQVEIPTIKVSGFAIKRIE
jgi:hypothetical protein